MKAETHTTMAETMMAREGIPLRDKVSSFKAFMTYTLGQDFTFKNKKQLCKGLQKCLDSDKIEP